MYMSFHLFMNKGVSHSESLPVCSWWAALESGWFYAMHEHNLSAVFSSLQKFNRRLNTKLAEINLKIQFCHYMSVWDP